MQTLVIISWQPFALIQLKVAYVSIFCLKLLDVLPFKSDDLNNVPELLSIKTPSDLTQKKVFKCP